MSSARSSQWRGSCGDGTARPPVRLGSEHGLDLPRGRRADVGYRPGRPAFPSGAPAGPAIPVTEDCGDGRRTPARAPTAIAARGLGTRQAPWASRRASRVRPQQVTASGHRRNSRRRWIPPGTPTELPGIWISQAPIMPPVQDSAAAQCRSPPLRARSSTTRRSAARRWRTGQTRTAPPARPSARASRRRHREAVRLGPDVDLDLEAGARRSPSPRPADRRAAGSERRPRATRQLRRCEGAGGGAGGGIARANSLGQVGVFGGHSSRAAAARTARRAG